MKLNRMLLIEYCGRLREITALATSGKEANAYLSLPENHGQSVLLQIPGIAFIGKEDGEGRRIPDEDDGEPMRKVYGYANAETSAIILDIDNEQARQAFFIDMTREVWRKSKRQASLRRKDVAMLALADQIEKHYDEENRPACVKGADVYSTLMSIALGRVDWQEVAEHLLTKMQEQDR